MEHGTIEREIHIDATPDVVYKVVSRPEHIREWWSDEAELVDGVGTITFDQGAEAAPKVVALTVVGTDPPRRFAFRWTHEAGEVATEANSLLVTIDLLPSAGGTTLRLVETGFRQQGWEVAVLEATYADHVNGWSHFVPRLAAHAETYAESDAGARA